MRRGVDASLRSRRNEARLSDARGQVWSEGLERSRHRLLVVADGYRQIDWLVCLSSIKLEGAIGGYFI